MDIFFFFCSLFWFHVKFVTKDLAVAKLNFFLLARYISFHLQNVFFPIMLAGIYLETCLFTKSSWLNSFAKCIRFSVFHRLDEKFFFKSKNFKLRKSNLPLRSRLLKGTLLIAGEVRKFFWRKNLKLWKATLPFLKGCSRTRLSLFDRKFTDRSTKGHAIT